MVAGTLASLGIPTPSIFAGMLSGVTGSMLMAWAIGLNPFHVSIPALPVRTLFDQVAALNDQLSSMIGNLLRRSEASERLEPRLVEATEPDQSYDMAPATPAPAPAARELRVTRMAPTKTPPSATRAAASTSRFETDSDYELPSLGLLKQNKSAQGVKESNETLEENARMLESVLADFGVKGQIIQVLPGPVVTLYEFEPAAGVKGARVISLAEDIARSMKAVSARVAVVPGKNAIGIELPTLRRERINFFFGNQHHHLVAAREQNLAHGKARKQVPAGSAGRDDKPHLGLLVGDSGVRFVGIWATGLTNGSPMSMHSRRAGCGAGRSNSSRVRWMGICVVVMD